LLNFVLFIEFCTGLEELSKMTVFQCSFSLDFMHCSIALFISVHLS